MISSIFVTSIKSFKDQSGEFKGIVPSIDVPKELLTEFDDVSEELVVNGQFEFETESDLVLVRLMNLSVSNGNRVIDLDLDKLDGNEVYELEERLAGSSTINEQIEAIYEEN